MAKEDKDTQGTPQEQKGAASYEDLVRYAQQLTQERDFFKKQVEAMNGKLRELSDFSAFKRLDYLFKVVELKESFSKDFVAACISEIEGVMTIPESAAEDKAAE